MRCWMQNACANINDLTATAFTAFAFSQQGNASKCVIACLADPTWPALRKLQKLGVISSLIELVKKLGDTNATSRKNAAIALAKFTRDPEAMEEVRRLRGVEILRDLGGKLT